MKPGKPLAVFVIAGALAIGMAGCSTNNGGSGTTPGTGSTPTGPVTLTLSGWSLSTTPEFQKLVDGFKTVDPNVTINIKEYDPNNYATLMLTDLTAKTAPDIITLKNTTNAAQWGGAGQLMDLTDLVKALPSNVSGTAPYVVNGVNYGVPYRQDSWVLFYNKDLFDKAGVAIPDGQWTWDDYANAAKELTTKLKAAGSQALGVYQHSWQSTVQGFANAQMGDNTNLNGPYFTGDYSYMLPYYQRVLDLQDSGAQVSLGDITTNSLTYQAEFGKQQAAMMLMGTWYIATLTSQQASGDADTFSWGMAPAPQVDSSTFADPVTFGDPTGMSINANIDPSKVAAAKEFLNYIASEPAAEALASIGITPSVSSDAVTAAVFSVTGMPTDALSKTAYQTHDTKPENPSGPNQPNISSTLGTAHTAIMTESEDAQTALTDAGTTVKNQDW